MFPEADVHITIIFVNVKILLYSYSISINLSKDIGCQRECSFEVQPLFAGSDLIILIFFSVALIKYPDKSHLKKEG